MNESDLLKTFEECAEIAVIVVEVRILLYQRLQGTEARPAFQDLLEISTAPFSLVLN